MGAASRRDIPSGLPGNRGETPLPQLISCAHWLKLTTLTLSLQKHKILGLIVCSVFAIRGYQRPRRNPAILTRVHPQIGHLWMGTYAPAFSVQAIVYRGMASTADQRFCKGCTTCPSSSLQSGSAHFHRVVSASKDHSCRTPARISSPCGLLSHVFDFLPKALRLLLGVFE